MTGLKNPTKSLASQKPSRKLIKKPSTHVGIPFAFFIFRLFIFRKSDFVEVESDDFSSRLHKRSDHRSRFMKFQSPRHRRAGVRAETRIQSVDIKGNPNILRQRF